MEYGHEVSPEDDDLAVVELVAAAAGRHVGHAAGAGGQRGVRTPAVAAQPDVGARRAKWLEAPRDVDDPGSLAPLGDQGHPLFQYGIHCKVELAAAAACGVGPAVLAGIAGGVRGGETSEGAFMGSYRSTTNTQAMFSAGGFVNARKDRAEASAPP